MRTILISLLIAMGLSLTSMAPATAGPFEDGLAAYESGDYATALGIWTPLAEDGVAEGQNALGVLYVWGRGVPANYGYALKWWRLAAEQGYAAAQDNLGSMPGMPEANRVRWWRLAAEQGYAAAQRHLAYALRGNIFAKETGWDPDLGVPQDYAEAMKWYRLAADQGDADAQHDLGLTYAKGLGVPQDYAQAAKWYRLAADQGDARAQLNLGFMYRNGQGVPQDYVQAHMWFNLAAAQDDVLAAYNRDRDTKKMTPEQIAEAQRLAREWMAAHSFRKYEWGM